MFPRQRNLHFVVILWLVLSLPLVHAETTTYDLTYDQVGNLQQSFDKYLEYNEFNQVVRVRENNAQGQILEEYVYDENGERLMKKEPLLNQSTYYISDDFVEVVNATGSYLTVYYHEGDTLVGRKDPDGRTFFYHPDHLGSTTLVTNESGAVVEETTYEPYGEVIEGGDSRFLFTSKELDTNTDMYYYGARYYDPFFTRFTQPDQNIPNVYDPQDFNRYSYVRNNPYKYVDPSGNVAEDVFFIGWDLYDIYNEGFTTTNAISLGVDVVGLAVPFVGGGGRAIKTAKALDVAKSGEKASDIVSKADLIRKNYEKGIESQKATLDALGLPENTKTFTTIDPKTGQAIGTRPDSLGKTGNSIIDVKDRQYITQTPQLRAQESIAKQTGTKPTIITGTSTKISKWVERRFNILRDLVKPKGK